MTNSKQTKKALYSSAVSLLLCFVMLIGTTFAWFTDNASTGVNTIQAGTLGIQLLDEDGKTSLEGGFLKWQKAVGHENDEVLWEPGATYNLQEVTVKNDGNLALKYKIVISGINGDAELNDVIDWTITVGEKKESIESERHLKAGDSEKLTISGTMQTTADNYYQGLSIEGASITVYATQDTVEYDSTTNEYDKDAVYAEIADSTESVNDVISNSNSSNVSIALAPNAAVNLTNNVANGKNKTVTFSGDGTQTVDIVKEAVTAEGGELNYQRGSSFIFQNVIVQAGEGNFDGIVCDELTYENCTIKGKITLYGKATFINCIFENDMDDQYSIWTWGGTDVRFEKCTFNTNGKAILLYGYGPTNLTVNRCTFIDKKSGSAEKAAIEIGNDYDATYTLTATNNTVSGFATGKNTNTKMYGNKNKMTESKLTVTMSNNTFK